MFATLALSAATISSNPQSAAYWIAEGLSREPCPIQVVPGPRIRVRSKEASFSLPGDAEIEFQPETVGIEPGSEFVLAIAGKVLSRYFGTTREPIPSAKYAFLGSDARVEYYKGSRRIGDYKFSRVAGVKGVNVNLTDQSVAADSTEDLLVFYGQEYLGRSSSGKFRIDARRLVPGYHEFFTVPRLGENKFGPLTMSQIWIPARLSIDAPQGTISIEGTTLAAIIKIKDLSSIGLQKYKFFLDSKPISVAELSQDKFRIDASYVPTGPHKLDVVGICKDGVAIATESVSLRISNPLLDAERAKNERLNKVAAMLAKVTKLDEGIVSLYEQALKEPELRTVQTVRLLTISEWGRSASVTLIDTWQVSGEAGKLLGECKARIVERARVSIEIGQLYSRLGRSDEARVWLQFALDSAGETNATGILAKSELSKLKRAS
jgi:hypothetical protein